MKLRNSRQVLSDENSWLLQVELSPLTIVLDLIKNKRVGLDYGGEKNKTYSYFSWFLWQPDKAVLSR